MIRVGLQIMEKISCMISYQIICRLVIAKRMVFFEYFIDWDDQFLRLRGKI